MGIGTISTETAGEQAPFTLSGELQFTLLSMKGNIGQALAAGWA